MIKDKSDKIQTMAEAILQLKKEIGDSIKGLPQNPNIKSVAENCFVTTQYLRGVYNKRN